MAKTSRAAAEIAAAIGSNRQMVESVLRHDLLGRALRELGLKPGDVARGNGHAKGASPTYSSWTNMKARCDNPKASGYWRYGGSGIDYDPSWACFDNFLADMGERPKGTSIDRIDNARGYWPDNCRWATNREQILNRSNTAKVTFEGCEWKLDELANHLDIHRDTLLYRIRRGWTDEQIRNTLASRGNCLKVTLGWHHRVPWNKGLKLTPV